MGGATKDADINEAESDQPVDVCSGGATKDAELNKDKGDQLVDDSVDQAAALTFASSNYFDDWLHRGWFE